MLRQILTGFLLLLYYVYGEVTSSGGLGDSTEVESENVINNVFPFPMSLFPVEEFSNRPSRRTVDWYKQFKDITTIREDNSMTLATRPISIGSLIGLQYTVSALLPGTKADNIYILRRRQDPDNGLSGISDNGVYSRRNEGAITVDCVLHINTTTSTMLSSYGNDTFYYPNAMVRDPQGNFWFSDAARHQVLRMNLGATTPSLSIGEEFAPGKGPTRLCSPNDVAVTTKHVYVADGHCNDRVVLYNKTGGYIAEFGSAPSQSVFSTLNLDRGVYQMPMRFIEKPQALAVDQQTDRLYIAESGQSRVVIVNAGERNESSFGTGIRYFQHPQLKPTAKRIALHPNMPFVFVLNSYNTVYLHRGFTFNTHDASFKGAWGPDIRGFVRPRAITVTPDGSTVYVADATEDTPEKIWVFTTTEYLRTRRNTRIANHRRQKGQLLPAELNRSNINYYNTSRALRSSTKGVAQQRVRGPNHIYAMYEMFGRNQGTKGRS